MRLIVTRPRQEAARWVQELSLHGVDTVAWPLIDIAPAGDPEPLREAWKTLADYAAVMFVSASAVAGFFEEKPASTGVDPQDFAIKARAWAPGPGTAGALRRRGVPAGRIDSPDPVAGRFDSEALWEAVRHQVAAGDRVLIVRGDDGPDSPGSGDGTGRGREWLGEQLRALGVRVDHRVAYRRGPPVWTALQCAQAAVAARDGSIWLFSSSQAVTHLQALMPSQSWQQARALTTHRRIAEAARQIGFGEVRESQADPLALRASIESWR